MVNFGNWNEYFKEVGWENAGQPREKLRHSAKWHSKCIRMSEQQRYKRNVLASRMTQDQIARTANQHLNIRSYLQKKKTVHRLPDLTNPHWGRKPLT
jgi:hypothetical protein